MNYCNGTACDFIGTEIRIAVVAEAPLLLIANLATLPDGQKILTPSFSYDVLHVLQFTMNFSYNLQVFGTTGFYNRTTDSWSGMVGSLVENKTDLGLGYTADLTARRQVVDYNFALATTKPLALFRKPTFLGGGASVLEPFDTYAWFGITSWALFTAVVLVLIQRPCPSQQPHHSFVECLSSCIHMLATLLCSKGIQISGGNGVRFVAVVTGLTSITLMGIYNGILVSFLTAKSNTFKDLYQLLRTDYDFAVDDYSQALRLRMEVTGQKNEAKSWHVRWLSERMKNSGHAGLTEAKIDLMRGSYVFITTDLRAYESLHHNFSNSERCSIGSVALTMDSTKHGTIMQKNSPWKRPLDYQIQRFKQSGFNNIWTRRQRYRNPTCEEMPYQPIHLTSVLVSVYIFGAGIGSGLSFLIAELLLSRTR